MLTLTLVVTLAAAAAAAPHYHHHHHGRFDRYRDMDDFGSMGSIEDGVFDTNRFWRQLETDLMEIDKMMNAFRTHFIVAPASAGVEGTSYKVRMPLPGFEEKDIVVKAREGVLMVQAIHKSEDDIVKNYLDMRTMPSNVDVNGVWTYDEEVLTITFPLKGVTTEVATEEHVTQDPISREEMGTKTEDVGDADIGLRSDRKEVEIQTNEIPKQTVEATTYAVDLKDQYEFVPVHYKK